MVYVWGRILLSAPAALNSRKRSMAYSSMQERLAANVTVAQVSAYVATPCHCWNRRCNNAGYPTLTVRVEGKPVPKYAHRVAVEVATGKAIPKGKEVDHRCYNTTCINPDHLEVVTKRVNLQRRRTPGATVH